MTPVSYWEFLRELLSDTGHMPEFGSNDVCSNPRSESMVSQGASQLDESWPGSKWPEADSIDAREELIFLEAIELQTTQERTDFVLRKCGGDLKLRRQVLNLLELHTQQDLVLDVTVGLPNELQQKHKDDTSGTRIGNYRLLKTLGEGGMGIVYLAN